MTPTDFSNHKSLCPLPWTGVYVNPDGSVKNCAISDLILGNIHDEPIEKILKNEHNVQVRRDMLNQNRHERCNGCYKIEDNSSNLEENESNRTWYKKVIIDSDVNLNVFESVDEFQPLILDLRWRNTCNRACVYCAPDLSSLWADILQQPYQINEDVLTANKNWIFSHLQAVKHVYLAGGEPLLIKENQYLLERLLEASPNVTIRINSNLSNINTPVFRLLSKFPNVMWTVSVDSKEKMFEYMRWPGEWKSFEANLRAVQNIVGDQINFNMVWCILNDLNILDTIDHLIDSGYHENMFIVQGLTQPSPLSVLHLPESRKQLIKNRIIERQKKANPEWWLYKSLSSMYNFLNQSVVDSSDLPLFDKVKSPGIAGTFEFLSQIDSIQQVDSRKIFPELYQYQ